MPKIRRIILSLDLAASTGYCFLDEETGIVKTGAINLARGKLGGRRSPIPMYRLWKRLTKLSKRMKIDVVIFEETFGRGDAKYRLDSLQLVVTLWAVLNRIRWLRVSPPQWKKATTGKGTTTKEEYWKQAIDRWPNINIHKDDIAAALWIMEYWKHHA